MEGKESGKYKGGTPEQFATSRYFKREATNSTNAVAHTLRRSLSIRKQQDGPEINNMQSNTMMNHDKTRNLFAVTSYWESKVKA